MVAALLLAVLALGAVGPARAAAEPLVCPQAVALIVEFEVGGERTYSARYQRPLWPGAASGVTVGIGYDLGHQHASIIIDDWIEHGQRHRLASAAGVIGAPAQSLARTMADIEVRWPLARRVFDRTSLVTHYRIARRVFVPQHFDPLPACARGALLSLVFNRGGSMTGQARAEMRAIRDRCLPAGDTPCIARELRAMARLWRGSSIATGMARRREAEAQLAVMP